MSGDDDITLCPRKKKLCATRKQMEEKKLNLIYLLLLLN